MRRTYAITIRLRGNVGDRKLATRRFNVAAESHAEALDRAIEKARDRTSFEVKVMNP